MIKWKDLLEIKFLCKAISLGLYVVVMASTVFREYNNLTYVPGMVSLHGSAIILVISIVLYIFFEAEDKLMDVLFMAVGGALNLAVGMHLTMELDDNFQFLPYSKAGLTVVMGIVMLVIPCVYAKKPGEFLEMLTKECPFIFILIALVFQIIVTSMVFDLTIVTPSCENMITQWIMASVATCLIIIATLVARYLFEGPPTKILEISFLCVAAVLAGFAALLFLAWGFKIFKPESKACSTQTAANFMANMANGQNMVNMRLPSLPSGQQRGGDIYLHTWLAGAAEVIACVFIILAVCIKIGKVKCGGGGGGGSDSYE